jgi:DNA-directed RNA polymerase specialized sigma24 family protein
MTLYDERGHPYLRALGRFLRGLAYRLVPQGQHAKLDPSSLAVDSYLLILPYLPWPKESTPAQFEALCRKIVWRRVLSARRPRYMEQQAPWAEVGESDLARQAASDADPETLASYREVVGKVVEALGALSPQQQEAMVRMDAFGCTANEVAAAMKIDSAQVQGHVRRGRRRFFAVLGQVRLP